MNTFINVGPWCDGDSAFRRALNKVLGRNKVLRVLGAQQNRGFKSSKVHLLHSLGETASAWLQMLFTSMIGNQDVVMVEEACLGGRKFNDGRLLLYSDLRRDDQMTSTDDSRA